MTSRADVMRVARSYLETPFHHMGRKPGVGLDCAGLVICVARELELVPADFDVPNYSPVPNGTLLAWCREHMDEIPKEAMQPGDVIVLRHLVEPQHLGILGEYVHGGLSLIHAANLNASMRYGKVMEHRLMFSRVAKFVAAFSLRGVS